MTGKTVGRAIGGALLLQIALAPVIYFRLLVPGTSPDFINTAAAHETQIRLGLLLLYAAWGMSLTIAVVAYPIFRQHSERLALLYFGLVVAAGATIAAELVGGRDMLSLSVEYAKEGAPKEMLEGLAAITRRHRIATHFANLAFAHAAGLVMWIILFRSRLVPRLLSGYGVIAATISTSAVIASSAGIPFSFALIQPLAIAMVLLTGLLLWKGFSEPSVTTTATATA